VQRLAMGTHTAPDVQNYLMIVEVKLPLDDSPVDPRMYDDQKGDVGNLGSVIPAKIDIIQKINHEGEINKARIMPQNDNIIATKTIHGEVLLFDISKHPELPESDTVKPEYTLIGHEKEGFGLAWSHLESGLLLSCSEDELICLWDTKLLSSLGNSFTSHPPKDIFKGHRDVVEDISWHSKHSNIFASVGDDKLLNIWDTREVGKPTQSVSCHKLEVNTVAWNPFSEFVIATGSSDKTIGLWDIRNLESKLYSLEAHSEKVVQVQWSPHHETIIASSSVDRRINIWDISRIGEELNEEDREDGPPELLFIHGGHTSGLSDFSWNPNDPWVIASVAEDNILQIWQMAETIYNDETLMG